MDQPEGVNEFLRKVGVQTCADIRGLWKTAREFCEEVESSLSTTFDPTTAFQVAKAFTRAVRVANEELVGHVDCLVGERASSQRLVLREGPCEPPPTTSIPGKVRRLLALGVEPAEHRLVPDTVADPAAKEASAKKAKVDLIFRIAMEDLVDLKELGLSWNALRDPVRLQSTKEALTQSASRLGVARLTTLLSSVKRWKRYCLEKDYPIRHPTALMMSEFLAMVGHGGPTAAASMWHALLWWSTSFGLGWPLDHFACKPYRFHAPQHRATQAAELEPWEFINLVQLTVASRGTRQVLFMFLLLTTISCVRYEHLQRSEFKSDKGEWLEFWCREGKARKKGARPGYGWACPNVIWRGWHLTKALGEFFRHESLNSGFLFPAVDLEPDDLWEIHEGTKFILNRPMARGRFLEIFRGALTQVGTNLQGAQSAPFNRMRRFMPTAANMANFSVPDLQAVGNWQEIPEGGRQVGVKPRNNVVMGQHYAGQQVLRSAAVKNSLVKRILGLFYEKQASFALTADGLLVRDVWSWDEMAALHEETVWPLDDQRAPALPPELEAVVAAANAGSPAGEPDVDFGDQSGDDPSSSSVSPSASAGGDDAGEGGFLPLEDAPDTVKWFKQGRKLHVISGIDEAARPISWCRDKPFAQEPAQEGQGIAPLRPEVTCAKCLARMPRGVHKAILEFHR